MTAVLICLAIIVVGLQAVSLALLWRARKATSRLNRRLTRSTNASRSEQAELKSQLAKTRSELRQLRKSSRREIVQASLDSTRQVQATLNLFSMVKVEREVPAMGGWAASPDVLLYLVESLLTRRPRCIVECGSGTSTLLLALAARQHGIPVRIVALEHDPSYAVQTRSLLERNGLTDLAEVRDAPLVATGIEGHETPWYDVSALAGVDDIGLLFVDGPPEGTGPDARFPAVALLKDRLAQSCLIVMDDFRRPAERAAADRWAELLPGFERSELFFQKGAGVFRRD